MLSTIRSPPPTNLKKAAPPARRARLASTRRKQSQSFSAVILKATVHHLSVEYFGSTFCNHPPHPPPCPPVDYAIYEREWVFIFIVPENSEICSSQASLHFTMMFGGTMVLGARYNRWDLWGFRVSCMGTDGHIVSPQERSASLFFHGVVQGLDQPVTAALWFCNWHPHILACFGTYRVLKASRGTNIPAGRVVRSFARR